MVGWRLNVNKLSVGGFFVFFFLSECIMHSVLQFITGYVLYKFSILLSLVIHKKTHAQ